MADEREDRTEQTRRDDDEAERNRPAAVASGRVPEERDDRPRDDVGDEREEREGAELARVAALCVVLAEGARDA